jgi:hypothetical protein
LTRPSGLRDNFGGVEISGGIGFAFGRPAYFFRFATLNATAA